MKVRCRYNAIDKRGNYYYQKFDSTNGHNYPDLEEDKYYLVMAVVHSKDKLSYMLDSGGDVQTYPYQLFEIVDNTLPTDWKFGLLTNLKYYNGIIGICGYKELIEDERHYLNLIEGDHNALLTYFKRKMELEKYYEDLEFLK